MWITAHVRNSLEQSQTGRPRSAGLSCDGTPRPGAQLALAHEVLRAHEAETGSAQIPPR